MSREFTYFLAFFGFHQFNQGYNELELFCFWIDIHLEPKKQLKILLWIRKSDVRNLV